MPPTVWGVAVDRMCPDYLTLPVLLHEGVVPVPVSVILKPFPNHLFQHPVYCMKVVGTQNAHNLISISTDGKMCSWSLDMLSQPQVSRGGYCLPLMAAMT